MESNESSFLKKETTPKEDAYYKTVYKIASWQVKPNLFGGSWRFDVDLGFGVRFRTPAGQHIAMGTVDDSDIDFINYCLEVSDEAIVKVYEGEESPGGISYDVSYRVDDLWYSLCHKVNQKREKVVKVASNQT